MKTPVTFSLSADAIAHQVLAISALRVVLKYEKKVTPAVLSRDRIPAIMELTKSVFAKLTLHLLPFVDDASMNGETATQATEGDDILLTIALFVPDKSTATEQGVIRRLLEHALSMFVLATAYADVDEVASDRFKQMGFDSMDSLHALLASADPIPERFPLCWL